MLNRHRTMFERRPYRGIRRGMICANCDAIGHVLKVTQVVNLFGRIYVEAQSTMNGQLIEGRDKDFVYRTSNPDLYARIVSGNFNPATGQ